MEDTTGRSAPGGYRGHAGLIGTEDIAGVEHRLVKLGRRYGHGGHERLSTVSLNQDEGRPAPTVNRTISTDCKWDGI
jgi:hypothetical protein